MVSSKSMKEAGYIFMFPNELPHEAPFYGAVPSADIFRDSEQSLVPLVIELIVHYCLE
ncbi:hypothetical protein T265_16122, partial [Opisthorchis viverrini]